MSELVREKPNSDPEDVLDLVSDTVSDELLAGSADLIAFREMWYYLRENGTADSRDLKKVAQEATDGLNSTYRPRGDWWSLVGDPIFRMFPGVIPPSEASTGLRFLPQLPSLGQRSESSTWKYDEDGRNWPDPPADTTGLPDEVLGDLLASTDVPGRNGREQSRSRAPIEKMYQHLEENGSASADELKNYYSPAGHYHAPDQGQYQTADGWFRDVGRLVLSEIPGIAPPRKLGDEWRFIGVSPKTVDDLSK